MSAICTSAYTCTHCEYVYLHAHVNYTRVNLQKIFMLKKNNINQYI